MAGSVVEALLVNRTVLATAEAEAEAEKKVLKICDGEPKILVPGTSICVRWLHRMVT